MNFHIYTYMKNRGRHAGATFGVDINKMKKMKKK